MPDRSRAAEPGEIVLLTRASLVEGTRILRQRDPRLGAWIDRVGLVRLRRQRHQLGALCRSIISQQLGAAAAKTIHRRFLELFAPRRSPDAQRLLRLRRDVLRRCGISERKVDYLRALAVEWTRGEISRLRLSRLSDAQVVEVLTRLPGIGAWTAEMFLIFSLGRGDVFSLGDLALREGVRRVEGRELAREEIVATARRWAPFRSVAALYLWKVAHWREDAR